MNAATETGARTALRLRVTGVVQGVGFRPFVHRLALRHDLHGWVRNTAGEVQIEIEGNSKDIDGFVGALRHEAPPLARIDGLETEGRAARGVTGFSILASDGASGAAHPVSPDAGICSSCEQELFDPSNRRYRYPFITCTDCGPRFTIIEAMPYDRERTTMRAFEQCPECRSEYEDPASRRYHSETNSCFVCGPRIWISGTSVTTAGDVVAYLAEQLKDGAIVALRGLGGFHLAVDATNEGAVDRLRRRKHRDAKPLAVMARTLDVASRLARIGPEEAALLISRERPIVLLHRSPEAPIAASVAAGLDSLGVMLASTPLHHLILEAVARPLVMTSGNQSEEPIAIGNEEAQRRLRWIADVFLLHDRDIAARYDDSVVRVAGNRPVLLRRARGYAPLPLRLPIPTPLPLLAVGAQMKNTFTLAQESRAFVSQHIGELDDFDSTEHFLETQRLYRRLFHVEPRVAIRDLHPDYTSTRIAEQLGANRIIAVQHHHAHIAAVMAEHDVTSPVVGVACDGAGYGDDGQVWGGEFLIADLYGYRRVAHLGYAPLPGGDLGTRQPWRAALGYLALDPSLEFSFREAFRNIPGRALRLARHQIEQHVNAPLTSSMGRLFDAAAAVLGIRQVAAYEAQAAMELEALAGSREGALLPFPLIPGDPQDILDPLPLLGALGAGLARGADRRDLAAAFHESVAAAIAATAARICREARIGVVALGGGVFQNARLLSGLRERLGSEEIEVLLPTQLGPNDGAVSYGQAVVGAARLAQESGTCA